MRNSNTDDRRGKTASHRQGPTREHLRRCILVGDSEGESRLAVAVAHRLIARGVVVTVIAGRDDADATRVREAVIRYDRESGGSKTLHSVEENFRPLRLPEAIPLGDASDLRSVLERQLQPFDAHCLLGLSRNAEQNLRTALIAHDFAPELPVVLRAFDPHFADELERQDAALHVRRAYSVAHLSAPSYVAAAVFGDVRDHIMTMRVGVQYVSVCRVRVPSRDETDRFPAPRRHRTAGLLGRTPEEIADKEGCQILGRIHEKRLLSADELSGTALEPDDQILVGGPLNAVLELARSRCGSRGLVPAPARATAGAAGWRQLLSRIGALLKVGRSFLTPLLTVLVAAFTTAAILAAPPHRIGDFFYRWASMAVGSAEEAPSATGAGELIGAAGLLAGGLALGLVTSIMSAQQVERRIVERMRRRARRLSQHVIIVGTDDVGLRVAAILRDLDIGSVIVEPNHGRQGELAALSGNTALQEVAEHTPILTGALRETLDQAGIDRASAVIASSEDNLVNVEACMRAKMRRGTDGIRTVARIFDDSVATAASEELGVDQSVAAVDEAAPAFVDAALERDCARTIEVDAIKLRGAVWSGREVDAATMRRWHADGIRVLALVRQGKPQRLDALPTQLECDDTAVLVGPPDAVLRETENDAAREFVRDVSSLRASR
jgi:Trk K+ transport system NAD-binding subunit